MNSTGDDRSGNRTEFSQAWAIAIACAIAAWLLIPPVVAARTGGIPALFRFFLQDTFYYLAVGSHSSFGHYTFDTETVTSGFHPLWQMYLTWAMGLIPAWDQETQIRLLFWSSTALTVIGYMIAGVAVYYMTGSRVLGLLVVPGVMNPLFWGTLQFPHSPWSYMNGMESPLTVLWAGGLFLLIAESVKKPDQLGDRFFGILGVVCALLTVSRLDDVFIVPALCGAVAAQGRDNVRLAFKRVALICAPVIVVLTVYCGFNFVATGAFLPVSGAAKAGFAVWENLKLVYEVFGLAHFDPRNAPTAAHLSFLYRLVQLFFPALAGIAGFMLLRLRGEQNPLLEGLCVFLWMKAAYNFLNVNFDYHGVVWYFTLSALSLTFIALALCGFSRIRFPESRGLKWASAAIGFFWLLVHLNVITMIPLQGPTVEYTFWSNRERIRSRLEATSPDPRLIEYDDGIINYSLGVPTLHGFGFVLDREGAEAKAQNRLIDYALARGFDIIASVTYVRLPKQDLSSSEIRESFRSSPYLRKENLDAFDFRVLGIHAASGATFVKVTRAPTGQ